MIITRSGNDPQPFKPRQPKHQPLNWAKGSPDANVLTAAGRYRTGITPVNAFTVRDATTLDLCKHTLLIVSLESLLELHKSLTHEKRVGHLCVPLGPPPEVAVGEASLTKNVVSQSAMHLCTSGQAGGTRARPSVMWTISSAVFAVLLLQHVQPRLRRLRIARMRVTSQLCQDGRLILRGDGVPPRFAAASTHLGAGAIEHRDAGGRGARSAGRGGG